jgi:tRNA A-37 threonylcarbamoyl transferase component Bud32
MAASREGEVLAGKYQLDKRLGAGGMGDVYRAENRAIGRVVAIKILRAELLSQPQVVQRFLREARAANKVRHPNVVDVLDVGEDKDGAPFIVQELLQGQDLSAHLEDFGGRISPRAALAILLPVIDAVTAAHRAGVIHRDLKPENVFLAKIEQRIVPKVLDFGISRVSDDPDQRLTSTNMAMGTPLYMAPEAIKGLRYTDARSDVWSLGVMLYELFTGLMPFAGDNQMSLFLAITTESPAPIAPSAAPDELAKIIVRCLEKDPARRFTDAGDLALALRGYLERNGGLDALSATAGAAQYTDSKPFAPAAEPAPTLVAKADAAARSRGASAVAEAGATVAVGRRAADKPVTADLAPIKPQEPAPVVKPKPLVFEAPSANAPSIAPPARDAQRRPTWLIAPVSVVVLILCVPILAVPLLRLARAKVESLALSNGLAVDGLGALALALAFLSWRWAAGEQRRYVAWDLVAAAFSWCAVAAGLFALAHPTLLGSLSRDAVAFAATGLLPWALALTPLLVGIYGVRRGVDRLRHGLLDLTDALALGASIALFVMGVRFCFDAGKPLADAGDNSSTTLSEDEPIAPRRRERATPPAATDPGRPAPRGRR